MSLVQIPAPRPYSLSLAWAAISSRSLNGAATTTGPKISSRTTFMPLWVLTQHSGLDEEAAVAEPAAAGQRRGTVLLTGLQEAADPLELLLGDQRAHLRSRLHAGAQLDRLGDLRDAVHHFVEPALVHEQARAGHAALAVVEEDRVGRALDRAFRGVFEDDVGALAAQFQGQLLQVAGPRRRDDQLAHLGGAGEGDLVDVVMRGEGCACRLAEARYDVHHPIGNSGLGDELGQP